MQCTNVNWLPFVHPPLTNNNKKKTSNYKSKLSISSSFNQSVIKPSGRNRSDDDDDDVSSSIDLPSHVDSITSLSNPFVKHCVKLRINSSYRHSLGSALVVGTTPIREICKFQESTQERSYKIEYLLLLDNIEVPKDLNDISVRIVRVSSNVMKKLAGMQSNESIEAIALLNIPTSFHSVDSAEEEPDCQKWFQSPHRVLVLEGIQDPGNLGTLLRSALAFRWNGAFLLPGCCDPFNSKALRASRGASFQIPIISGHWNHLQLLRKTFQMKLLAGHPHSKEESTPVSTLSPDFANSLADKPVCLILGSEGSGLSDKSMEACELVSIPMAGKFESLNVAVAGGIFLFTLHSQN